MQRAALGVARSLSQTKTVKPNNALLGNITAHFSLVEHYSLYREAWQMPGMSAFACLQKEVLLAQQVQKLQLKVQHSHFFPSSRLSLPLVPELYCLPAPPSFCSKRKNKQQPSQKSEVPKRRRKQNDNTKNALVGEREETVMPQKHPQARDRSQRLGSLKLVWAMHAPVLEVAGWDGVASLSAFYISLCLGTSPGLLSAHWQNTPDNRTSSIYVLSLIGSTHSSAAFGCDSLPIALHTDLTASGDGAAQHGVPAHDCCSSTVRSAAELSSNSSCCTALEPVIIQMLARNGTTIL